MLISVDADLLKALADPLRTRILSLLSRETLCTTHLMEETGARQTNLSNHLRVLREAGLVHLESTRQVRGGTEQYFKRTAQRMQYDNGDATKAMLTAVGDEVLTDESDPLLLIRNVRLNRGQAERLRLALEEMVHGQEDEEDGSRYAVMVALYRPRQASE